MATNAQLLDLIYALQADVVALGDAMEVLVNARAALEARVTTLEATTCPQQTVLDDYDARLVALEGAAPGGDVVVLDGRVAVLEADHVPLP